MGYVNLHCHDQYSILDGLSRTTELVQFAVDNNQGAIAQTNHGNLFGALKLYETATASNIKPLIGVELYVERTERGDVLYNESRRRNTFHLIALASNDLGYKNLCKLITRSNLENFYYKNLVTHEMLAEHNEGLIILSGCLGGEVAQSIVLGGPTEAIIREYKDIFGARYFLEIHDHGIPEEEQVREELLRLSIRLDIPLVATQDSHFTHPEDADAHDTMLAMQVNKLKSDPDRFHFSGHGYHLATEAEMMAKFGMYPEAVTNSGYIADLCNVEIKLHQNLLPQYNRIPSGMTASEYLKEVTIEGLRARYVTPSREAMMRMYYELEVIERTGFDSYMLIIWDVVRQARCDGVRVGPGRGSAAGSLVAYALGITNVDPLKYNLLFERFLNLERVKQPDVDLDFDAENRDKVIEYAVNTYGADKVAQIATIGTLAARSAIKGVAKSFGVTYGDADALANTIPYSQFGSSLQDAMDHSNEFQSAYNDKQGWQHKVIDTAMRLEGVAKHSGTHAAGVVISPVPLADIIPLQRPTANDVTTSVAQYEMDDLAKIGLLKVDFLGLSTLTLVDDTLDLIKSRHSVDLDIDNIPVDDPQTFALLQRGNTHGVFQLESYGARKVLAKIKPTNITEIAAVVAINRPGPLQSGVLDLYAARKSGQPLTIETMSTYPDELFPELAETLKDTFGTIVYQESIMLIAQAIAGYSLGEADGFREAMGKKDKQKMHQQRRLFIKRALQLGHDKSKLNALMDIIEPFAAYGFNLPHAVTYGVLGYQTAYLRAHYPIEFQCALLNMRGDDKDKLPLAIKDARFNGIQVLSPSLHVSQKEFTLDGDAIRYGLMYVKGFGESAYNALDKERQWRAFTSLEDMLMRCNLSKLNSGAVKALILAGALSDFEPAGAMLHKLDDTFKSVRQVKEDLHRESVGMPAIKRRKPPLITV